MSKRQVNLIVGIAVILISVLAYSFSNISSKNIFFGNKEISPTPEVDKEVVIGESSISSLSPTPMITFPATDVISKVNVPKMPLGVSYQVVKVVDGDTIDVNINGIKTRLRLIGIDTPETVDPRKMVQCFGKEASDKAKVLLTGQSVILEADPTQGDRDKYGRSLRYVFLPDGTNFNLYMILEGFAHEYTYRLPYKYQAEFKQAEIDARNGYKGLWNPSTCNGNK